MKRYIVWFDFPYGRTYLKGSFIDDSNYDRNVEIPEFTHRRKIILWQKNLIQRHMLKTKLSFMLANMHMELKKFNH